MPRVSVVVCTYNRCESLRDNLQSLRDQQLIEGLELEMVVVDNNSKDGTPKVVEEVGRTSAWPVRYLFEPIQGKSHALNRGIKAARGDFIAFCDDDVIADQLWIQSLCEAFLAYDADAVGGPVRPLWFGKPPKWLEDPERQFGMLAILDRGDKPIIAGEAEQAAGNFLLGSNLAIRSSVLGEIGSFRTDLGPAGSVKGGCEDSEMVRRLLTARKRLVYVPTVVVEHKIPLERMRLSYLREWNFSMARSTARMSQFRRVTPTLLLWDCVKSALVALVSYAVGAQVKAVGAEIIFWWRLGTLTEMLMRRGKNDAGG